MAGKANIEVYIKGHDQCSAAFQSIGTGIQNMSRQFRMAGMAMVAFGGAILGAMTMSVKSYADAGDAVAKMAKRTGIATESLSILKYMADISGTGLEAVEKAAKRMAKTITDASEGMATYIRAFERIGIEVKDLIGLSPEEQFWKIASAIGAIEDPTLRAATAQDIFGRAGTELLPMLDLGAEGIKSLAQEARDLAPIFSEEDAAACEEFNDSITRLKASSSKLIFTFAEELMPILTEWVGKATEIISKIKEWTAANPELTKELLLATVALGLFAAIVGPLLIVLPGLSMAVSGLGGALVALIAAITGVKLAAWEAYLIFGAIAYIILFIVTAIRTRAIPTFATMAETLLAPMKLMGEMVGKALGVGELMGEMGKEATTIPKTPTEKEEALTPEEILAKATATRAELRMKYPHLFEEYQKGGIVRRPTLALLGEKGPEAIIPLGIGAGSANNITLNIGYMMADEATTRDLAQKILAYIREDQLRTTGLTA